MLAVCAMAVSFTSCERQADPAKEPVAGKTFQYTYDDGQVSGYIKFIFHMNHNLTNVIKDATYDVTNDAMVWEMKDNAKDFDIKMAPGTVNQQTGEPVGGMIVYKGTYDAETSSITVTLQGTSQPVQYVCTEVK